MVPAASFDPEKAPFLDGDGSSATLNAPDEQSSSPPQLTSNGSRISAWSKNHMRFRPWVIHVVIIVSYTVLFFALIYTYYPSHDCSGTTLLWSPAQNAVDWETRVVDAMPGSTLYAGFPNAESDTAWSELLRGIHKDVLDPIFMCVI
ncbi:hypothetical protein ANO14919_077790 [Xylariales sp. No.14919]|nr:hypothetical protein ANO14919_077790 [Xylariales sp. No.14919]